MSYYKGFEVDDRLYGVIRHMNGVEKYRDDLHKQQVAWDYLSVLGQLAKLDTELSQTRKEFTQLTGTLLNQLGLELLNKSVRQYAFKAQVAINIMIRNLFERTADIGFIATDDDVCAYLKQLEFDPDSEILNEKRQYLLDRFEQYVAKYSVYHNIILLDTQGNVVLQLDQHNPVTQSKDPLIMESLHTENAYVENFRYSDLLPNEQNSLIYSYRVVSPEDGHALGVICLCFKFKNECDGIFAGLLSDDQLAIVTLLNKEGKVIASSSDKVALNARFKPELSQDYSVVNYEGVEYFCCTRQTDGFQGYHGSGWLGFVMVPLRKIFSQQSNVAIDLPAALLDSVMQGALFNAEIKNIPVSASQIQRELNRLVWNGNVQQATDKSSSDAVVSKVLLSEIKHTGVLTKHIFENSIADIQKTVIASVLQDSMNMAALAIDIMDRNLYERANDCRWWALTTTFRSLMSKQALQTQDVGEIQSVLHYINSLYTVYGNIIVFDTQGRVIAVSNPQEQSLQGQVLTEPWVRKALALRSAQDYVVSDFVATPLYNALPSYIYAAAIHAIEDEQVLGGIGIVFDAAPQFLAMLQDVLPQGKLDGEQEGQLDYSFAVYTDADKSVIASTHKRFSVGDLFDISDDFFALTHGQSMCKVVTFHHKNYAVGCSKSAGYREYKGTADHYQQEVFAFVLIYLGEETQAVQQPASLKPVYVQHSMHNSIYNLQLATFYVGNNWLALSANQVASAIQVDTHLPISGGEQDIVAGYLMYRGNSLALVHTSMLLGGAKPMNQKITEVVVVKIDSEYIGLVVDALGEMMDVAMEQIRPVGAEISAYNQIVKSLVLSSSQNPQEPMLQIIDVEQLSYCLQETAEA